MTDPQPGATPPEPEPARNGDAGEGVPRVRGRAAVPGQPGPYQSGGPAAPATLGRPAARTGGTGPEGEAAVAASTSPAGTTGPAGVAGQDVAAGPTGVTGHGVAGPGGMVGPGGVTSPPASTSPAGVTSPAGPAGITGSAGATVPGASDGAARVAAPPSVATTATDRAGMATPTGASTVPAALTAPAAPPAVTDHRTPPHVGAVYSTRRSPPGPDGNGRQPAITGRMARLRIGSHTVSRGALTQLGVVAAGSGLILGAGLVLGTDRGRDAVTVRLFRPEPTRVTLVGGAWAGQLVVFRALALGARVAVFSGELQVWQGFGERATGRGDRVATLPADRRVTVSGTAQRPILHVYDLGAAGASTPPELGPWQAQLTILRQLDRSGAPSAQDSQVVLLQRLTPEEAALAGDALQLPGQSVQFLQSMPDDMIALVDSGTDRYVWLTLTDLERQLGGAPRR